MRREDRKKARLLRSVRDPIGADYVGWFRLRTEGFNFKGKPECELVPVDEDDLPGWYYEEYKDLHSLRMEEGYARSEKLAPGSLALLRLSKPHYSRCETQDGTEYDCDTEWEVCYAAPHPYFEEAWRRFKDRLTAAKLAEDEAKREETDRQWRQPWRMAIEVVYHNGLTFDGCGDGPPRTDDRLRSYVARLVHDPKLGFGSRSVTSGHWLAYGKEKKTKDEAVVDLQRAVLEAGRDLSLAKVKRILNSSVW